MVCIRQDFRIQVKRERRNERTDKKHGDKGAKRASSRLLDGHDFQVAGHVPNRRDDTDEKRDRRNQIDDIGKVGEVVGSGVRKIPRKPCPDVSHEVDDDEHEDRAKKHEQEHLQKVEHQVAGELHLAFFSEERPLRSRGKNLPKKCRIRETGVVPE